MKVVKVDTEIADELKKDNLSVNEYLTTTKNYLDAKETKVIKRIKNCNFVCPFKKDCFNYYDRPCPKLERESKDKKNTHFKPSGEMLVRLYELDKPKAETPRRDRIILEKYMENARSILKDVENLGVDVETIKNLKTKIAEAEKQMEEL